MFTIFILFSVMSVKKVNFHHMHHLRFPSPASRATKDWTNYEDTLDVPSIVLMENMGRNGAEIVFVAFRDLASILDLKRNDFHERKQFLNSRVAYVSMHTSHKPMLPEPIRLTFAHLYPHPTDSDDPETSKCVHWDQTLNEWAEDHCRLVGVNATHTECVCAKFGLFGVLRPPKNPDHANGDESLHISIILGIVLPIFLVFLVVIGFCIGLDYCQPTQVCL